MKYKYTLMHFNSAESGETGKAIRGEEISRISEIYFLSGVTYILI